MSFLAKMPCGGHGTANSSIRPWLESFFSTAGFDLIWFGIFLILVVEMAEVSPPVGFNLFVLQTMSGKDSNTVALAALPFFFLLVAAVAIITVFPQIVMVLPQLAFPD